MMQERHRNGMEPLSLPAENIGEWVVIPAFLRQAPVEHWKLWVCAWMTCGREKKCLLGGGVLLKG